MNEFRIKTLVLGAVSTNCYFIYKEREAVVVDPADNAPYILKKCRELGLTVVAVLLTHGHFDHMLAAGDIRREYGCKIYAGMQEDRLLKDASLNLSGSIGSEATEVNADVLVRDGEVLDLAGYQWKVIETPGHTAGSVCYLIETEDVLISGDTLFEESLGRTDLPTGDSRTILDSIMQKLLVLPDDIMVYPGHGNPTTIQHEKQYNPVAVYHRR